MPAPMTIAERLARLKIVAKALAPLSRSVFNDNSDITITNGIGTYEECIAAHFAQKHVARLIACIEAEAAAEAEATGRQPITPEQGEPG